jgi:flagellar basal-body rod protein FlgF
MDKAIYLAMTGAKHNMIAQAVHSNNLANVATDGFRRDLVQARSIAVIAEQGLASRAYAMSEKPATDFSLGQMRETGRDLDVAVDGKGWVAVQAPNGQEAYVRGGSLQIDPLGRLTTGKGLPVLGNGGPVAIPPAAKVEIGADGTISVRTLGQGPETLATVDRIKLVKPATADLEKRDDGLIYNKGGGQTAASAQVSLVSGFLEGSNVNAVESLTEIMGLARQYEMQVKMMRTVEQNGEAAARLLQVS